ncbi:serine/threonine-protein kinase [Oscillatoria amoena NRMC-F 0135]|nr:serine/threonine-protein kinase [Oscillatoria laete-virens]MDL5051082.1 serine/threonine-protein kinase [Oscillatoria amoena NRMC-F 0135]MDL5054529.1 serine/threonine-protein kinase [Oscillatoria laete-virens NRMC-F 0139]
MTSKVCILFAKYRIVCGTINGYYPDSMAQVLTEINCLNCNTLLSVEGIEPLSRVACPVCGHENLVSMIVANYKIVSIIGTGGQGTVYRAQDMSLNRIVAVKLLKQELTTDQQFITNFAREARSAAMVTHPYVVQIYSFGVDDDQYYLAMELMEKGNLDERIESQGRIPEIEALQIGAQIAAGLQAAFEKGLIHRDIKPGNILFDDHMQAKLVDFGLATVEGANPSQEIWGTPYYISPEKLSGGHEDFRSDIYSLGATLFHAIAGRPPFEGEDATEIVAKHMKSHAVSLQAFAPQVADETAYVINKMLHKNPYERYASYEELIQHLNYAREQIEARFANPGGAVKQTFKMEEEPDKNPFVLWGIIGMAVVVVGLVIFTAMNYKTLFGFEQKKPAAAATTPADGKLSLEQQDAWNKANEFMAGGQFAEALEEYNRLKSELPVDPQNPVSQWIPLQMLAAYYGTGETTKIQELVEEYKAGAQMPLPQKITPENLTAGILKVVTTRRNTNDENNWLTTQDREAAKMTAFYLGMKALSVGNHERAVELFKRSNSIASPQAWMGKATGFAVKFDQDYSLFKSLEPKIAGVSDAAGAESVIAEINSALTRMSYSSFVDSLRNSAADLQHRFPQEGGQ